MRQVHGDVHLPSRHQANQQFSWKLRIGSSELVQVPRDLARHAGLFYALRGPASATDLHQFTPLADQHHAVTLGNWPRRLHEAARTEKSPKNGDGAIGKFPSGTSQEEQELSVKTNVQSMPVATAFPG